jgi:hypothetical protein
MNNGGCPFRRLMMFGENDWNNGMNWKLCVVNLNGVMSIALSQSRDGTYQTVSSQGVCHPQSRSWAGAGQEG